MSRNVWRVFIYELRRNLRRKGFLFATFGIPIIAFVLLFGYQAITTLDLFGSGDDTAESEADEGGFLGRGVEVAGYVDLSGLFPDPGEVLSDKLIPYDNEEEARSALDRDGIDVYYVIAEDYLDTGNVRLVMPQLSLNQVSTSLIERMVYDSMADDLLPSTLLRLRVPANIQVTNLARELPEGVDQDRDASFALVYVFAIAFLVSVFLTNGYLMQSVIEEKESRLIEILIASLRPVQLLAGKILALGLLGLTQIAVWVGAVYLASRMTGVLSAFEATFLANLYLPLEIMPVVLAYFVLGYLFFAAAYGMVGALSGSMQEGPQYAVIFTLPAAIPFYFFSVFLSTPDGPIPVVFSLFPLTASLSMVMRMVLSTVPAWQIGLSLGLLALADVGMMWLAGRLFRVQILLAGQTPRLRDLPKLVRG